MEPHAEQEAAKPRPDYPPKTPPPPKKPPSPPPPQTRVEPSSFPLSQHGSGSGRPVMKNRPGAAWQLESRPWAGARAYKEVSARLAKWGMRAPDHLESLLRHMVAVVVADGGRHISVHLAEQNRQILLLALGHRRSDIAVGDDVLPRMLELGAVSCSAEMTAEGRQVWAVLDLTA
ncbi:hypothetical protein GCM10010277_76950 [Streptomyces longisporoflavus]|uniref:hypothetical protein n=1 Tax=Streptomyces longisporoflavus TaxID=28044 RepID=UPI0019867767|nr:hypothetical protein [Streptomyces longisporoflavus]GGV67994.1 hypothetical protein GCM10010277_76950 [Streptomyces longisporoflavus]